MFGRCLWFIKDHKYGEIYFQLYYIQLVTAGYIERFVDGGVECRCSQLQGRQIIVHLQEAGARVGHHGGVAGLVQERRGERMESRCRPDLRRRNVVVVCRSWGQPVHLTCPHNGQVKGVVVCRSWRTQRAGQGTTKLDGLLYTVAGTLAIVPSGFTTTAGILSNFLLHKIIFCFSYQTLSLHVSLH